MFPDHLNDIDTYNNEMSKSLEDKIWFTKHISVPDSIIDYGCADGQMIRELSKIYKNTYFVGYDISKDQLEKARINNPKVTFLDNFDEIIKLFNPVEEVAIIANSVTHEVYYYSHTTERIAYWLNLFANNFKYVIIRDLALDPLSYRKSPPLKLNFKIDFVFKILNSKYKNLYFEYLSFHCPETVSEHNVLKYANLFNTISFLLKYRYTENWEREKREDYFPLSYKEYFNIFPSSYEVIYKEHYALPFNVQIVKNDFDIDISKINTHAKFILRNVNAK